MFSYPLLFAAAPLQITLALIALPFEGRVALYALAYSLLARTLVTLIARYRVRQPNRGLGWVMYPWFGDLLLLAAFFRALTRHPIEWRGVEMRVERGRVVVAEPPPGTR